MKLILVIYKEMFYPLFSNRIVAHIIVGRIFFIKENYTKKRHIQHE